MEKALPAIPAKRYFTIGEVSDLCGVKPYVLRYWEQEFTQLKPMKRRGNRRYYQHHEVLLIRRIRELLYEQGFTISGARNRLAELQGGGRNNGNGHVHAAALSVQEPAPDFGGDDEDELLAPEHNAAAAPPQAPDAAAAEPLPLPEVHEVDPLSFEQVRHELLSIRGLLVL
jgi:DNA-binding transcriptional MerR regulator